MSSSSLVWVTDQRLPEIILDGHRYGRPRQWRIPGRWEPLNEEYTRLLVDQAVVVMEVKKGIWTIAVTCMLPGHDSPEDIMLYRIGYVGEWNLPTTWNVDLPRLTIDVKSGMLPQDPVFRYGNPRMARSHLVPLEGPSDAFRPLLGDHRLHVVENLPKSRRYILRPDWLEVVVPHPASHFGWAVRFGRVDAELPDTIEPVRRTASFSPAGQ